MSRLEILHRTIDAFYKTGIVLLNYVHGAWEGLSGGDDLGYFFYTTYLAYITGYAAQQASMVFFLGIIVLSFLLLFIALFVFSPSYLSALLITGGLFRLWMPLQELNHLYVAYFFAFSVIPLVLLLQKKRTLFFIISMSSGVGVVLGIADRVRIYAALPVLVFIGIYILGNILITRRHKVYVLLCVALGYGAVYEHFFYKLQQRNLFLKKQRCQVPQTHAHLFWHNIYAGFGYLQNPYGIEWSDTCCAQAALQKNNQAVYATPLYDKTVKQLVLQLCREKKYFVLTTLFAKLGVVFYFFLLYFGWLGLVAAYYVPKPWYIECAFLGAAGVSALPGLLTLPVTAYLVGFISCTIIYTLYSVLWAYKLYCQKKL